MALVSSVAVYRFNRRNVAEDGELLSEHTRLLPMRAYRVSKLLGERAARRLAMAYSMALTVVRPGQLYGAFDALLPTIRRLLQRPIVFVPHGLRIPMADGGDVAKAIVRCLEEDDTMGGTFNLTGSDRSAQTFVQAWREAGGRVGRLRVPIPVPIPVHLQQRACCERAEFHPHLVPRYTTRDVRNRGSRPISITRVLTSAPEQRGLAPRARA